MSRAAMQQALEALEDWHFSFPESVHDSDIRLVESLRAALDAPLAEPEPVAERGPWEAGRTRTDPHRYYVESDDFRHDVRLYLDGDFGSDDDKRQYVEFIARALNSAMPNEPLSFKRVRSICDAYESGVGHGLKYDKMPAIEYAEQGCDYAYGLGYKHGKERREPEPEPVLWQWRRKGISAGWWGQSCVSHTEPEANPEFETRPLYTTLPQRKPLTDEQIKPLIQRAMQYYGYDPEKYGLTASAGFFVLARAVERAHGIK